MPLADLTGQAQARERLLNMIARERVAQTLLFSGPEGVGKHLAARLFAQALSCRERVSDDACGHCPSCIQIERGLYPDLLTIAAEKQQIKLDQVAEIREFINFSPIVGERRIVIIEDAHKLNQEASNALLKTLEEPFPTVLFILLSHRHSLLLETILSRCLLVPFVSLPEAAVVEILRRHEPGPESGAVSAEGLAEAAAWSGGSMSRALFFLEDENRFWFDDFIIRFSRLPQATPVEVLDLAEAAAGFPEREVLLFMLRSFLHDGLLAVRGLDGAGDEAARINSTSWRRAVQNFAAQPEAYALLKATRERLLVLEEAQGVNVNIHLAFDALFTAVATGTATV